MKLGYVHPNPFKTKLSNVWFENSLSNDDKDKQILAVKLQKKASIFTAVDSRLILKFENMDSRRTFYSTTILVSFIDFEQYFDF